VAGGARRLSRGLRFARSLAAVALALLTGAAAAAPARGQDPAPAAVDGAIGPLRNERHPLEGIATGGAPESAEGFRALAEAGYRTYVDLRSDPEATAAARAEAEAAGLAYELLPVSGEAELDLASARALDALLDDPARYPLVLACSSGNRVGALLAVEAFWLDGESPEAALELGLRAGLTRLEPSVRLLLGLPPAPPAPDAPAVAPVPASTTN
jgi:protein tyrosine phosphatase (PTP) superfamily phosphohydrolase (DUF442 family)